MRSALIGPRGLNILHVGSWSLAAKVAGASNLFFPIPFVLEALGPAQFGVWVTLLSLTTLAGFLDFGFSNGAMNLIAAAHARDAPREVATIVREATIALTRIAVALVVPVFLTLAFAPWHRLFGLPDSSAGECRFAVAAILVSILAAIPLNLAYRAQLGLRRGQNTFRWQAIGQVLSTLLVIGLAKAGASLPLLTAAAVLTPTLASLLNALMLFRHEALRNTELLESAQRKEIRDEIQREGLLFFVLQLAVAISFASDLALISAFQGPGDAGRYAIVQRLFSVIPLAFSLVWVPLWPTYRQSLAVGDQTWALRTLRRSIFAAFCLSGFGVVVLVVSYPWVVALWLHTPVVAGTVLIVGFAGWTVADTVGAAIATFLNAASVLRFQVISASAFAIACVAGKLWVLRYGHVELVPWVTLSTYLLCAMLPFAIFRRRLFASVFRRKY